MKRRREKCRRRLTDGEEEAILLNLKFQNRREEEGETVV